MKDEHYNYFDDRYSPEYAIDDLIDLFTGLDKAWLEIKETECYQDYGLPRKGI